MKKETRYIVASFASIPVTRLVGRGSKGEMYRSMTVDGWGLVEWYSASNNYKSPVSRDKTDKTQQLMVNEDCSGTLYSRRFGQCEEFVMLGDDVVILKDAPSKAETDLMILSGCWGYDFWAKDISDIRIFVTYDEDGLICEYRIDGWEATPYEGETEIRFEDLQSEVDYESIDRADVIGTF